jgi:hypothetical protein
MISRIPLGREGSLGLRVRLNRSKWALTAEAHAQP